MSRCVMNVQIHSGTCIQDIHPNNSYTRSHASEEENRTRNHVIKNAVWNHSTLVAESVVMLFIS
jgi:hypothetical protein